MAAYKDEKRGTWFVSFHYVDWTGANRRKMKRGFITKKEALEWERHFLSEMSDDMDMTLGEFTEIYLEDMKGRIRENTLATKKHIFRTKILPYFENKKMNEITPPDIRNWQNEIMKGDYKPTYLKTVNNQLNALFNYAVRYYDLHRNPCLIAGAMGKDKADEMEYWTVEEFNAFLDCIMDKPMSYIAFKILFWTGMRLGELLALNVEDVNLERKEIRINKSLQKIKGKDVITEPKTPKSRRTVTIPGFLAEDIEDYISTIYEADPKDRLIPLTKTFLEKEIKRGIHLSGVKNIHIHCLRHSNTVLMARLNLSPVEMAARLGHEKIETTLNIYSHVIPERQNEIAEKLNEFYKEGTK